MTTTKIIELLGESREGWQDAVENAIREASKTVDEITGVEVVNLTANVQDGRIVEYKACVQLAFPVRENRPHHDKSF